MNNMEELYDYVFWFNSYESLWYAIKRDNQLEFFNGSRSKIICIKSKDIDTLIELICKPIKLKELNED
jgi:hypothetical protein